jgi:hypothetical protein
MPEPKLARTSYGATIFAKVSDEICKDDIDAELYRQLHSKRDFSRMKSERTRLQMLLSTQILAEALVPEEYEHTKRNGDLYRAIGHIISAIEGPREVGHDLPFKGTHTKVTASMGQLYANRNGILAVDNIVNGLEGKGYIDSGFMVEIWNNNEPGIGSRHIFLMAKSVTDVIKKYGSKADTVAYYAW